MSSYVGSRGQLALLHAGVATSRDRSAAPVSKKRTGLRHGRDQQDIFKWAAEVGKNGGNHNEEESGDNESDDDRQEFHHHELESSEAEEEANTEDGNEDDGNGHVAPAGYEVSDDGIGDEGDEKESEEGEQASPKARPRSTFQKRAAGRTSGLHVPIHHPEAVLKARAYSPNSPTPATTYTPEGYYSHTILTSPFIFLPSTFSSKRRLVESFAESTLSNKRIRAFFAPPFSSQKSYFFAENLQNTAEVAGATGAPATSKVKVEASMPGGREYREACARAEIHHHATKGFILGYPPSYFKMPEGLDCETIVRYFPNHLVKDVLLRVADQLSPKQIAETFGDEERLKPNTMARRIATERAKKTGGAPVSRKRARREHMQST